MIHKHTIRRCGQCDTWRRLGVVDVILREGLLWLVSYCGRDWWGRCYTERRIGVVSVILRGLVWSLSYYLYLYTQLDQKLFKHVWADCTKVGPIAQLITPSETVPSRRWWCWSCCFWRQKPFADKQLQHESAEHSTDNLLCMFATASTSGLISKRKGKHTHPTPAALSNRWEPANSPQKILVLAFPVSNYEQCNVEPTSLKNLLNTGTFSLRDSFCNKDNTTSE